MSQDKKTMNRITIVLLPVLCSFYPVVFLFSQNADELVFADITLTLAGVLAISAVLFCVFLIVMREPAKTSLFLAVFLLLFYSYGHVYNLLEDRTLGEWEFGRHRYGLPFFGLLIAVSGWKIRRSRRDFRPVIRSFTTVMLIMTLLPLTGSRAAGAAGEGAGPHLSGHRLIESLNVPEPAVKRDIYYLVFDRYGNEQVLRNYYGYENRPFLDALRERGFVIGKESRANYLKSEHSLASSLNLDYINEFAGSMKESSDMKPLHRALRDFALLRFLRKQGYLYAHSGSWWQPTGSNPNADYNINRTFLPEFARELFETTALYPVAGENALFDHRREQWERVRYKFEKLARLGEENSDPVFVFAHFLIPHMPYVFDRDGSFLTKEEEASRTEEENYVNQLVFLNQKILELLDAIMSTEEGPEPLIILQADEGPYPDRYRLNREGFPWNQATYEELDEKTGILNAFYLPDEEDMPAPDMTPVNTFRYVLNEYFNAGLPLVPDRVFAFESRRQPYRLFDATKTLKAGSTA